MRHFLNITATILMVCATVIACVGSYKSHTYSMQVFHQFAEIGEPIKCVEYAPSEYGYMIPSKVPLVRTSGYVNLTFEEMDLLEQIAMSEARGEGSIGMALVMRVVLNRSLRDNMSIHDVIYAPNQFYTAGMMRGNDECHEALAMVMDGWDESQGACYFQKYGYSIYGTEDLFQYGAHYFSK